MKLYMNKILFVIVFLSTSSVFAQSYKLAPESPFQSEKPQTQQNASSESDQKPLAELKKIIIWELLKALELEIPAVDKYRMISEKTAPSGLRLRKIVIPEPDDTERYPKGLDILYRELAPTRVFYLMYSQDGRLLGVIPVVDEEAKQKTLERARKETVLGPLIVKYFDFSPYYFKLPEIDDPEANEKWQDFAGQWQADQLAINKTIPYAFEELEGFKKSDLHVTQPAYIRVFKMGTEISEKRYDKRVFYDGIVESVAFGQKPFFYLETMDAVPDSSGTVFEMSIRRFNPDEYDPEFFKYKKNTRQAILPVFPTVYTPYPIKDGFKGGASLADQTYYSAVYPGWQLKGLPDDPDIYVVGPGPGIDVYLAWLRSEKKVFVSGVSPIEIANTITTANIIGFDIEAIVADNIVNEDGEPHFPGMTFDLVCWDMPYHIDEADTVDAEMLPYRSIWDSDFGSNILERFLPGLNTVLKKNRYAIIWNLMKRSDPDGELIYSVKDAVKHYGYGVREYEDQIGRYGVYLIKKITGHRKLLELNKERMGKEAKRKEEFAEAIVIGKTVEGNTLSEIALIKIADPDLPVIAVAPHCGMTLIEIFRQLKHPAVSYKHLDKEVDIATDIMIEVFDNMVAANLSRALVDLNRAIETAIYDDVEYWDVKHVWKRPLTKDERDKISRMHREYFDYLESIIRAMVEKHGYALVPIVHSYTDERYENKKDYPAACPVLIPSSDPVTLAFRSKVTESLKESLISEDNRWQVKENFVFNWPGFTAEYLYRLGKKLRIEYGLDYDPVFQYMVEFKKAHYMNEESVSADEDMARTFGSCIKKAVMDANEMLKRLIKVGPVRKLEREAIKDHARGKLYNMSELRRKVQRREILDYEMLNNGFMVADGGELKDVIGIDPELSKVKEYISLLRSSNEVIKPIIYIPMAEIDFSADTDISDVLIVPSYEKGSRKIIADTLRKGADEGLIDLVELERVEDFSELAKRWGMEEIHVFFTLTQADKLIISEESRAVIPRFSERKSLNLPQEEAVSSAM